MELPRTQLRHDSPHAPSFLMVRQPPASDAVRDRMAEWLLAKWMNQIDPNIMGVRRVVEEKDGNVVPVVHIAIPLVYQRKHLARALAIKQILDETTTARVNLISSVGSDEAHSYIRLPAEVVLAEFTAFISSRLLASTEINDVTVNVNESLFDDLVCTSKPRNRLDDDRLVSAVQRALAMKNAAIESHQIQMLMDRRTREKWIKIIDVDTSMDTPLKHALRQAGIQAIAPSSRSRGDAQWAVLFAAKEAEKLLFE